MENNNLNENNEIKNNEPSEEKRKKHWIIIILLFLLCISICILVWKIGKIGYIPVGMRDNTVIDKKDDKKNVKKNDKNNKIENRNNNVNTQNLTEQNSNNLNDNIQNGNQNYNNEIRVNNLGSSSNNDRKLKQNTNKNNQNQENNNESNYSKEQSSSNNEKNNSEENSNNNDNNVAEAKIEVKQGDINAELIEDLDIFKNPEFNNQKIIAPKSKGRYNFTIKNLAKNNISYNIMMTEENKWNINLKYKLKQDNIYIVGNQDTWVDIDDLNVKDLISTDNSEHLYTLEWYWEDAENDTEIGTTPNVNYKLKINVVSKAI